MAGEQTPQPPRLSDLPDVGELKLPPERKPVESPEELVRQFPADLRDETLGFMGRLAKTILAQQTTGGEGQVRVSPEQTEFYRKRFNEILDSGFLDPHDKSPKKIS